MTRLTVQQIEAMTPEEFKKWDSLEAKMDILKRQKPLSREEMAAEIKRNSEAVMNQKLMQTEKDKRLLLKNGNV